MSKSNFKLRVEVNNDEGWMDACDLYHFFKDGPFVSDIPSFCPDDPRIELRNLTIAHNKLRVAVYGAINSVEALIAYGLPNPVANTAAQIQCRLREAIGVE